MAISEKEILDFEATNGARFAQDKADCESFLSRYSAESGGKDEDEAPSAEILKGKIIKITADSVMVDIGGKAESRMSIDEIRDENGANLFGEGDEIELLVSTANGRTRVSYKQALRQAKVREIVAELGDSWRDKIIEVKVVARNKGGYVARWEEKDVECFLPRKDAAIKQDAKLPMTIKVCLIRCDESGLVASRKRYFDVSGKVKKEKIEELLKKDAPLKGTVTSVKEFGIFVEVDGVEGLVHSSEISHKGFANPSASYKVGDKVEVKILRFDEEKSKLSLSIKALSNDPWKDIDKQLQVGYTIKAVVSSIQPYGAFVDAGNNIEGFLHITEISWEKNIKNPSDYLKIGQEIDVEIIELNPAKKHLRVSLKKLSDKPFTHFVKKHKEGDVLTGEVATLTDFGAFVRFGNIDGLLHNEDLSWEKQSRCKDSLKIGDKVEVKILKIDRESEKISLSRKAILESPIQNYAKAHKIGDPVSGKIIEIKDFGIFVQLEKNIDALIKNEDLSPLKKQDLKLGDPIEASIFSIDTKTGKIRLSVKKLTHKKEQDEMKNYSNDDKITLGDVLKNKIKQNG